MSNINDDINKLLAELEADKLDEIMSPEELNTLRKKLNPYGRTIQGSGKILTASYTDLRKEYMTKLLTTTFIGFLNRACDEWHVPEGMVVLPVYDYLQNPAKLDEVSAAATEKDRLENAEWMQKRVIVKEFLEHLFQFDPDRHVRSAYRPNPGDPQRSMVLDTPAAKLAVEHHKRTNPDIRERMLGPAAKKAGIRRIKQRQAPSTVKPDAKDEALEDTVYNMIPPHDVFHHLNRYYDANYEELRDAVTALYCEKPDLETAINPYDWHETMEDAEKFIAKHKDEVIAPIYPLHSGKWNLFGPFKSVQDSVRYYNDNTIVLEEIMKQREMDEKLGRDLMKKRIKVKKQQNIKEAGPDDPAFLQWAKQNDTLKAMGALDNKEEDDCPPDAIEVPILKVSHLKQNVEKTKFFTEAEAPPAPTDKKEA